jgi:hypothetical protein
VQKKTIESLYATYKDKLKHASDRVKRELLPLSIKSIVVRDERLQIKVRLPLDSFAGHDSGVVSSPWRSWIESANVRELSPMNYGFIYCIHDVINVTAIGVANRISFTRRSH